MNVARLLALADAWREEARTFRRRGLEQPASMAETFADELVRELDAWRLESLTLAEAAEESGLSYSTLQQRIAAGDLPNAGTRGAPRIRREDLPRKGTRQEPEPDGPDVAGEVLANRAAVNVPDHLRLYRSKDAAGILGVEPGTLSNWRTRGDGPQYVKVGGRVMYRLSDLRDYLEGQARAGTRRTPDRRAGELLKQFQTGPQGGRPENSTGGDAVSPRTQREAAEAAGMSQAEAVGRP